MVSECRRAPHISITVGSEVAATLRPHTTLASATGYTCFLQAAYSPPPTVGHPRTPWNNSSYVGGRLRRLLRSGFRRVAGQQNFPTTRAEHTASTSGDWLGAVLPLAPSAAAMRLAVLGAARLSGLGAARLLAPPSPTMRKAVMGAAIFSCLGTARLLTPSTAAMCHAVVGGALSCLGTSRLLTPPSPTMRLAVARGAYGCVETARLFTPMASTVRHAVARGASSCLGTPRPLTPSPSSMCHAEAFRFS